jgi:TIR domain
MIVILYEVGCETFAAQTTQDIDAAFNSLVPVRAYLAEGATAWSDAPAYDDLLIVIFKSDTFPTAGQEFITHYLKTRFGYGLILPVAISPDFRVPPSPANEYKALQHDPNSSGTHGSLTRRVGSMLGFRLQGRDAKIFLSHRATDGAHIAAQLYDHFTRIGYLPYLDQEKDLDGDTKILPGSLVQQQLDEALENASLLLLIDTPGVLDSKWIRHEVDTANGMMLPVLPVCFRGVGEPGHGPRFRSLLSLQRWKDVPLPPNGNHPLAPAELDEITEAAEQFLCEVFRRRCRVPFLVRDVFESKGFAWDVLDKRKLMYRSTRKQNDRLITRILSHCSIFEHIYDPSLDHFRKFLRDSPWANHSLYIYDGPMLPDSALLEINDPEGEDRFLILHHQELAALIHSNFTTLECP